MTKHKPLQGKSILLVEDEYFIADDMVRAFKARGASIVGPAGTVAGAMKLLGGNRRVDAAVLDVNLQGEMVFPVADALSERGIRFIFVTGYERVSIPEKYAAVVRCEKPIHPDQVLEELTRVCG